MLFVACGTKRTNDSKQNSTEKIGGRHEPLPQSIFCAFSGKKITLKKR